MSNSSNSDNDSMRIEASDLPKPDPGDLDRINALSDDEIDCSDIPEIMLTAGNGNRRLVLIQLDEETFQLLRRRGVDSGRIGEFIRRQLMEHPDDAA